MNKRLTGKQSDTDERQRLLKLPLVLFFDSTFISEVEKKRGEEIAYWFSRKGTVYGIIGYLCAKPEILAAQRQPNVEDLTRLTEKEAVKLPANSFSAVKKYLAAFGLSFLSEMAPSDTSPLLELVTPVEKPALPEGS